jgi:outer membrane immunogenic protein
MRKVMLAGAALAALISGPSFAADLARPVYKALPPPVELWSWSGFYLGVNVGYSFGRSNTDAAIFDASTGDLLAARNNSFNMNGVIGGGQIGVNWQTGVWVWGLEADIQGSGQKGDTSFACAVTFCNFNADTNPSNAALATVDQRLQWFGTARVRAGVTVAPTVLAYVTGGLAYGEIKTDLGLSGFTTGGGPAPLATASSSTTKAGWTVGGGFEARLGGNWTGKIEYLYMDLGTVSGSVTNPFTGPPTTFTYSSHITDNIVRVGLNYKLGYGPVVAKY